MLDLGSGSHRWVARGGWRLLALLKISFFFLSILRPFFSIFFPFSTKKNYDRISKGWTHTHTPPSMHTGFVRVHMDHNSHRTLNLNILYITKISQQKIIIISTFFNFSSKNYYYFLYTLLIFISLLETNIESYRYDFFHPYKSYMNRESSVPIHTNTSFTQTYTSFTFAKHYVSESKIMLFHRAKQADTHCPLFNSYADRNRPPEKIAKFSNTWSIQNAISARTENHQCELGFLRKFPTCFEQRKSIVGGFNYSRVEPVTFARASRMS